MKHLFTSLLLCLAITTNAQQTVKSKFLKLKYSLPSGWTAQEFGGKTNWEEPGNDLCRCAGVLFTKPASDGKLNVLVYPSTRGGMDSTKRNNIGSLRFVDVVKYEKTKNKVFSFEKKRSNFTDSKTMAKSYDVVRYVAKVEDTYYVIYTWQETMKAMDPDHEKFLFEMVNALEPL